MRTVKNNLSKVLVFIIRKLHTLDAIVTKNEEIDNPNRYEDLTPIDNADEDKKYSSAIAWALKNENVKNIAITGPYGAGKSSVLRTFEREHKGYKYLNISLGSFKDDIQNDATDGNRNSLIEKSVLQQIFYRVTDKVIPFSRFSRIKNIAFHSYLLNSVMLVLWLATAFYAYKPENKLYQAILGQEAFDNQTYLLASIIFALLGAAVVIKQIFAAFSHFKLNNIAVSAEGIKFDELQGASILNKHLDEILYFFEKTKFDVVVIEDLDRFDEVDIFIKLRELNTLINNADQICRKIVFIYAIRDDVFQKANRTKFFDFIIPIIPVINASNSGDILFKKLSNSAISRDFVNDITLYIEDMRMLKNIHNEFVLYQDKLTASGGIALPLDKLLGFIVYKNKYPDDFAQLNLNTGMVAGVFNCKRDLVNKLALVVENSIDELKEELFHIENEKSPDIIDLRRMYVAAVFEKIPSCNSVYVNNGWHGFASLLSDVIFVSLRSQTNIQYQYNNYSQHSGIAFRTIENFVDPNFSYDDRERLIIKKTNGRIEAIKKEIQELSEQKRDIHSLSVKNLIEIHSLESIFDAEIKKEKLLVYLIRNGYIDEMYETFISHFYEGNITKNDLTFIFSVKNQEALSFTHSLNQVKEVIKRLNRADFKKAAVLNFDLLSTLFQDSANNEYLELMMDQISNNKKSSLEFIDAYLTDPSHEGWLIHRLCKRWPDFWNCILRESGYTAEKKNRYLKMIILHADIEDVVTMNGKAELTRYVAQKEDFLSFTADVEYMPKLKEVVKRLAPEFVYIENPEANEELFSFVYENDFYAINEKMIALIIQRNNPDALKGSAIQKSNYTTILESNCPALITYINTNINEYVEKVMLLLAENVDEAEETIVNLLNNENLEDEYKVAILQKENARILDISTITDVALWDKIITSSKVKATWENLLCYFANKDVIDDAMVTFLNRQENYEVLTKSRLKESDSFSKEIIQKISRLLIVCVGLSDQSYERLVRCIPYWYSPIPSLENLSSIKVGILIKNGKFQFTQENFDALKKNFNPQYALLVEKHIDDYLQNIATYELDAVGVKYLLKSEAVTTDQKITIIHHVDANTFDGDTELARLVYAILLNPKAHSELRLPLLEVLLKQDRQLSEKVRLLNSQMDFLAEPVISSLITSLGSPFLGIASNQQPVIENSSLNKQFAEKLKEKGIISSFKEKDGKLRLYPKKNLKEE
ncbi:MAG: hypothetical protein PHI11_05930 [Gallionella sp.]|nr:hypothetical protein [Gallionella sp.]